MIYATLTAQNSAMINLKPEQNILRIGTDSKDSAQDKQVCHKITWLVYFQQLLLSML